MPDIVPQYCPRSYSQFPVGPLYNLRKLTEKFLTAKYRGIYLLRSSNSQLLILKESTAVLHNVSYFTTKPPLHPLFFASDGRWQRAVNSGIDAALEHMDQHGRRSVYNWYETCLFPNIDEQSSFLQKEMDLEWARELAWGEISSSVWPSKQKSDEKIYPVGRVKSITGPFFYFNDQRKLCAIEEESLGKVSDIPTMGFRTPVITKYFPNLFRVVCRCPVGCGFDECFETYLHTILNKPSPRGTVYGDLQRFVQKITKPELCRIPSNTNKKAIDWIRVYVCVGSYLGGWQESLCAARKFRDDIDKMVREKIETDPSFINREIPFEDFILSDITFTRDYVLEYLFDYKPTRKLC